MIVALSHSMETPTSIFVAGATGVLGRRLVPSLVEAGYAVVGTTRSREKAGRLKAAGADAVVLDALDRDAVVQAVADANPDVVMHQLTDLQGVRDFKRFDEEFAATNRLRTVALDYLLEAAVAAGARRFIAQSYTGWPNERSGSAVKTEDDPLDAHPTAATRESLAAIRYLETTVTGATNIEGLVLRYGMFYGPGTAISEDGEMVEMIRKRRFPVVGDGRGVWSFVHVDDAGSATVAAVSRGRPGIYNVVDDEPARVAEWLPYLAEAVGAKQPLRLPAWLVRPILGEHGISMMTRIRGSSNEKTRRELSWQPAYPTWRQGFTEALGMTPSDEATG